MFASIFPTRSRLLCIAAAFLVACLLAAAPARAAEPAPFTAAELDQKLASIALFPDALLSQVLMASTYPSDVAQAVDWAYAHRQLEGDAAVQAVQDKPWDPSVQSLVAFPQVLAMLGENPQWVRDLGDAFLEQPADVMDSVQFLRAKAKEAGNLASNEQQVITIEPAPPPPQVVVVTAPPPPTQIIVIAPANPRVVFVPIFNPLWAFGPWWHPAFPPFFFPPPPRWGWGWSSAARAGFWWGAGIGVSNALWGGVDWRRRDVNINVNRWNTINVNHRIDSRDRDVSWRHNANNRHGVPYRMPRRAIGCSSRSATFARATTTAGVSCSASVRATSLPIVWARRTSTATRCATSTGPSCRSDPGPRSTAATCATAQPAWTAASCRTALQPSTGRKRPTAQRVSIVRNCRTAPPPQTVPRRPTARAASIAARSRTAPRTSIAHRCRLARPVSTGHNCRVAMQAPQPSTETTRFAALAMRPRRASRSIAARPARQ